MICPKCANEVDQGVRFCPYCGTNVFGADMYAEQSEQVKTELTDGVLHQKVDENSNKKTKQDKVTLLSLIAIALVVIMIICSIIVAVLYKRKNNVDNDSADNYSSDDYVLFSDCNARYTVNTYFSFLFDCISENDECEIVIFELTSDATDYQSDTEIASFTINIDNPTTGFDLPEGNYEARLLYSDGSVVSHILTIDETCQYNTVIVSFENIYDPPVIDCY